MLFGVDGTSIFKEGREAKHLGFYKYLMCLNYVNALRMRIVVETRKQLGNDDGNIAIMNKVVFLIIIVI